MEQTHDGAPITTTGDSLSVCGFSFGAFVFSCFAFSDATHIPRITTSIALRSMRTRAIGKIVRVRAFPTYRLFIENAGLFSKVAILRILKEDQKIPPPP